ncbi:RNA polymerase sigma factor SigA [Spirochaetia bacterium]|nr:RNA polymerase sigma factor SigA [Spirochaetia bacterium]
MRRSNGFRPIKPEKSSLDLYFQDIRRCPLLTTEEEKALYDQMVRGKESGDPQLVQAAWNKLIEANLRLVISIAKRFHSQDLDFEDLIEEGNCGLFKAVERFDPERGYWFNTLAGTWVKAAITHAIRTQARLVRLPEYLVRLVARKNQIEQWLIQKLGRKPLVSEVAAELGLEPAQMRIIECVSLEAWSLDAPLRTDVTTTLGDTIGDTGSKEPLENIAWRQATTDLYTALKFLSEREQFIIRRHYGLDGGKAWTLGQLSAHFNISGERVRQIEKAAFKRMQESTHGGRLKEHLEMVA